MSEPRPLDYETRNPAVKRRQPKTHFWFLFYFAFVLVSVWMAIYILTASDVGFFYGIFGIFAQVIVWVLTSDLHRHPQNPADDMNLVRKILLGLGMGVCLLSVLVRLFHY